MAAQPSAAILSVGTELTEGSTQDTHGRFIAELLHRLGVRTRFLLQIPDDFALYKDELGRLIDSCDLVIVTGGLGPTSDDLTREAIAAVSNSELEFHQDLWDEIRRRFSGRMLSETNRKQALIPAGFGVIRNPRGTAPAFWGWTEGKSGRAIVVALPGPPRELRPLMEEEVLPLVQRELDVAAAEELRASAFLLSESLLEEFVADSRLGTVEWGTRAEPLRIVLILRGGRKDEREKMYDALVERVGPLRVRRGEVEANGLVIGALKESGKSLVAAESCTGGLVGKLLTDLSGASDNFWGSVVAYSNEAKSQILGVPGALIAQHGAVSAESAGEMAAGALRISGADFSCSITGIAGPTGGTPNKPVGTVWIGVRGPGGKGTELKFQFSGDRDMVRRKAAVAALLMCEATIRGKEVDNIEFWQYI